VETAQDQAWAAADDTRTRAFAAKLVGIDVIRGYYHAGSVADARDIVPAQTTNVPKAFVVESKFVEDDELFMFAHLCEIEFTLEVARAPYIAMVDGGMSPRLFLETFVDGDEQAPDVDRAPRRMMAQLQIEAVDGGERKFRMWQVDDRSLWPEDPGSGYTPTILPKNWFHFYTPDRSMRRTFDEVMTQSQDSFIDLDAGSSAPGIIRMKLIVRNKSGESTPFRLHIDRFQLAFLRDDVIGGPVGTGEAVLQDVVPLVADANRSGEVNEIDIIVFAADAAVDEPAADLDQDGLVTGGDVSTFFEAYSSEVQ